jgi:hypothetical protein
MIMGALIGVNILFVLVMLSRQEDKYKTLTIALSFYSVLSLLYVLWYPDWHHIFGVAPVHIFLLVALFHGWVTRDHNESKISRRQTLVLVPLLLFIYLPGTVYFYLDKHAYQQTFKDHQLYNWSFEKATFESTADPSVFVEATNLIKKYSQDHKSIFIISKYDHILPVLAEKYSALPYIEMPMHLVSYKEIVVAANAILKNNPEFLFVDTDIGRNLGGDMPELNDPVSVALQLHRLAKDRTMVMQNLNEVFTLVTDKYVKCETGRLISVYCRKPSSSL